MLRIILVLLGHIFLAIGLIGIFVPLLPTTPFILIAGSCYAKGSERFYSSLMKNAYCRSVIQDWQKNKAISMKSKILAISLLLGSMVYVLLAISHILIKLILTIFLLSVSLYIARRPS